MTPDQLADVAAGGESEVVEFKRTTGEAETGARAVCAMLNHRGGRVLFGVAPNGAVVGQDVGENTIERLAQRLRDIDPPAFPSIDRVPVASGKEVLVVTVGRGQSGPYTYRHTPYRRVGSSNEALSQAAFNSLLLEASDGLPLHTIAAQLDDAPTLRQVRLDLDTLRILDLVMSSGRGRGARWRLI